MLQRLILALVLVLGIARVQAGETEDAVGKMHFDQGTRAYEAGRWKEALDEFKAGYELTHRSAFLINIAQSHRRLGDYDKAREFYKTYLYLEPKSPLVPKVNAWIAEIDAEAAVATTPSPSLSPSPSPSPSPELDAARPRPRRVATWVGLALTVASLGAAAGLEGAAKVRYDDLRASCAPHACTTGDVDGLERLINGATGMFAVTGVLAVGTIIAAILETRAIRRASLASSGSR